MCVQALQIKFEPEVQALFSTSVTITVGNGASALFWADNNWIEGKSVAQIAPNLAALISSRVVQRRTVAQDINGGLSIPVLMEYIRLWNMLADFHLSDAADSFRWRWTADGKLVTTRRNQPTLRCTKGVCVSREPLAYGIWTAR